MTIALSVLTPGLSEFMGAVAVISTATGGDATKIVDTALSIYGDTYFDDWWAYVTSGLASGDVRQVEDFDKATTTLDPYVDFSGAVGSGDDYELNKYNKADIILAINDALLSIYPKLHRKIVFEDLGHSLLTSDAASGQTDVIVADGSLFFAGQELTLKDDNNSEDCTISSISSNTLTMTANLTNSYATADSAEVFAKSGKYFNVGATLGTARITGVFSRADATSKLVRYRSPWGVVHNTSGDKQLYFPGSISVDDQTWVIEAIGYLEEVSDPTDTITLEDRRVKLLYSEAAYQFYERLTLKHSAGDVKRLRSVALSYRDKVNTVYRNLWMATPAEVAPLETDSDYD